MQIEIAGIRFNIIGEEQCPFQSSFPETLMAGFGYSSGQSCEEYTLLLRKSVPFPPVMKRGNCDRVDFLPCDRDGFFYRIQAMPCWVSLQEKTMEAGIYVENTFPLPEYDAFLKLRLRLFCALILANRGGVLVHSSSVRIKESAFLFCGQSGAGKSTLAALLETPVGIMADDCNALLGFPDNSFHVWSTPFTRSRNQNRCVNSSAPLAALYFLRHGSENRLLPVEPQYRRRHVLQNLYTFPCDASISERVMDTAERLSSTVPMFDFSFIDNLSVRTFFRNSISDFS